MRITKKETIKELKKIIKEKFEGLKQPIYFDYKNAVYKYDGKNFYFKDWIK